MYTVTHWEILQFKQLPLWYQKIYKKKMLKKSEKETAVSMSLCVRRSRHNRRSLRWDSQKERERLMERYSTSHHARPHTRRQIKKVYRGAENSRSVERHCCYPVHQSPTHAQRHTLSLTHKHTEANYSIKQTSPIQSNRLRAIHCPFTLTKTNFFLVSPR